MVNPAAILEQKLKEFIARAPKIAGVYAVEHFRDNVRRRGGVPVNGALDKFSPRGYDTAKTRGKKILINTGNMIDAIRITGLTTNQVRFGISQSDIAKYARIHLTGGTIRVSAKMKSYFWAMYYKSAGSEKKTKTGKDSMTKGNVQARGDAGFWRAMALKEVGSKITIPKREFMRLTPDIEKGIMREFEHEINNIKQQVKQFNS